MSITVVGVDHRHSPAEVQAALALDAAQVDAGLAQLAVLHPDVEALLLATCARTELILAGDGGAAAAATWHQLLAASGVDEDTCRQAERRVLHGQQAVRHVLRVAAGLDSPLLGDVDILAQLRDAAARARAAGLLGPALGKLVDEAIAVGRSARSTTQIAAGAPSVAAAVVAELAELRREPENVVIVGAGSVARAVLHALPPASTVTVVNRTVGRAIDLVAGREGARAVALHRLSEVLSQADAVVVAVGGGVVLTPTVIAGTTLVERGVPVVDASAPRGVEPVPGLDLVPLERLHEHRDATTTRREAAVPAVERIVDEAVADWQAARDRSAIEQAIAQLYRATPELISELTTSEDPRDVERRLRSFLHDHVQALRGAARA